MRSGTLRDCLLIGNQAGEGGGGYGSALFNCTVVNNHSHGAGGGGLTGGYATNCIVWGNTAVSAGTENFQAPAATPGFTCASNGVTHGVNGNITSDPLFVNPAAGNYRLLKGSPCMDQAHNNVVTTALDLDGNPRIANDIVDMGAYEFTPAEPQGTLVTIR